MFFPFLPPFTSLHPLILKTVFFFCFFGLPDQRRLLRLSRKRRSRGRKGPAEGGCVCDSTNNFSFFFSFSDISRREHSLPSAPATISPKNSYLFWRFSYEIDIRGHPRTLESTGIQTRGILFSATVACLRLVKASCRGGVLHFH